MDSQDEAEQIDSAETLRGLLADLTTSQTDTASPKASLPTLRFPDAPPAYETHFEKQPSLSRRPPSPSPRTSSMRPSPQHRSASTSQIPPFPYVIEPSTALSPTFDPPPRSIFTSGPPTASLSASTAQASLSTAASSSGSRPLAALGGPSPGRRAIPESVEDSVSIPPPAPHSKRRSFGPEKTADDPSVTSTPVEEDISVSNTSATLSRLFATSETVTPSSLSRGPSHLRTFSGAVRNLEDTSTLTGHLLRRGFMDGRHSDITIHAFKDSYQLHKLLLDRVPFFASAFSGSWSESSAKEMTLHPEDVDPNITKRAFELALKRVYGSCVPQEEDQEAIGLFATACWLDMSDLVDSSVDILLRQMHPSKLGAMIKLVTSSYYGKAGDRILTSARAMLCREGWEMPYEYWDTINAETIREIIGADPFYVPGEWERWFLALKLLNRRLRSKAIEAGLIAANGRYLKPLPANIQSAAVRLETDYQRETGVSGSRHSLHSDDAWILLYASPEIAPLLVLLDKGIHYVHLRFEQLQQIRTQKDILGFPVLPQKVVSDALWMSMELRQRVVNASENTLELGLSEVAETSATNENEQAKDEPSNESWSKGKQRVRSTQLDRDIEGGSWDGMDKPQRFWIPSNDVSCIMGGSHEACGPATSPSGADWTSHISRLPTNDERPDGPWVLDITGGIPCTSCPPSQVSNQQQPARYSTYPPFRFSAEFPNPRTLREKKRVYSKTVWYAGSMWNLYIQRLNTSKNQQLSVYLHRAKGKDPSDDPLAQFVPATVDDRIGQLEREMLLRNTERRSRQWHTEVMGSGGEADREEESSGSGHEYEGPSMAEGLEPPGNRTPSTSVAAGWRKVAADESRARKASQTSNMKLAKGASARKAGHLPDSDEENEDLARANYKAGVSALPPYVDARPTIKTYFKIYSPSKAGRLLSIYESTPERFDFSQSRGWKNSPMILDDGMYGYSDEVKGVKDMKLRYMVVIGNV